MKVNIKEIQKGDIFSEISNYVVEEVRVNDVMFKHTGTGTVVNLSHEYVANILRTADQYEVEVEVGIKDKLWTQVQIDAELKKGKCDAKVGDLKVEGIQTLWSKIGSHCFTVCFTKQGKELSDKAWKTLKEEKAAEISGKIQQVVSSKKGVSKVALDEINNLLENPVTRFQQGDERILRGVKLAHESVDGFYTVLDLDLVGDQKRLVNLPSIKWLVFNGVKYIVK